MEMSINVIVNHNVIIYLNGYSACVCFALSVL